MSKNDRPSYEIVPVLKFLVLNSWTMHKLGKSIVEHFGFKYYVSLCCLLKLCMYRSKRMYEPAHLNYASAIIGRSMKGVDWQKDLAYFPVEKTWAYISTNLECQAENFVII